MAQRSVTVQPLQSMADADWLHLRRALWPHCRDDEHLAEMASSIAAPQRYAQFIARAEVNKAPEALGFAEASLRSDYVVGTETSPVAFLEGLYVVAGARRQGVARALVTAVIGWARQRGCRELASDTQLANQQSQQVHAHLGFEETERIVCFRMALANTRMR
jgi:aminoglycoside 6'-N-acetyltransferase I